MTLQESLIPHKAIAGEKNGGVGPGVSPKTALSVGLKVDADALPDSLKKLLAAGKVNLDDPATTIALLRLNAVVGVTAFGAYVFRRRSVRMNDSRCAIGRGVEGFLREFLAFQALAIRGSRA